eukprot:SAG31_NODE_3088_length_4690_cov_2.363973_3_plen_110_part_00
MRRYFTAHIIWLGAWAFMVGPKLHLERQCISNFNETSWLHAVHTPGLAPSLTYAPSHTMALGLGRIRILPGFVKVSQSSGIQWMRVCFCLDLTCLGGAPTAPCFSYLQK